MAKLNLNEFTHSTLVGKLFVIQKDFKLDTQQECLKYAREKLKENFEYPQEHEDRLTDNLLLYLLGNENNMFSNVLNK